MLIPTNHVQDGNLSDLLSTRINEAYINRRLNLLALHDEVWRL